MVHPTAVTELLDMVRTGSQSVLPRGGGSKPALSRATADAVTVEMGGLSGIIDYEPGEYTFTAYAGTAVAAIQQALAQNGQYLPFDPLLTTAGATLGGTVAANSCGSGRYRYGGVRDFILGVRFVDGHGRLIRAGGKVVKNAAGFDLPKFMVGSLGRYGLLVELSFKVFPQPPAYTTLVVTFASLAAALQAIFALAPRPFDMDALDMVVTTDGRCQMLVRLGGLPEALPPRVERLWHFLQTQAAPLSYETIAEDDLLWQQNNALAWAEQSAILVKVPVAPQQVMRLDTAVARLSPQRRYTAGGNVAWFSVQDGPALDKVLTELALVGLALWGGDGRAYYGQRQGVSLAQRVKRALDPAGRFLDDR